MRLTLAAAAAALALAAPAAAQPDPETLARQAFERLVADHEGVDDYTLVLEYNGARVPAYVYRDGDEWEVATPEDTPLGDMLSGAVMWPAMIPADGDLDELFQGDDAEQVVYAGIADVNGRRAHVLSGDFTDGMEELDSLSLFVDAETRHLLRMSAAGTMAGDGGEMLGEDAAIHITVDLADYTRFQALTIPTRIRLRMDLELQLEPAERMAMQAMVEQVTAMLRENPDMFPPDERIAMEVFTQMFSEGRLDVPVTVSDVRVNAGPPEWLDQE